jgi:hypothetical protein
MWLLVPIVISVYCLNALAEVQVEDKPVAKIPESRCDVYTPSYWSNMNSHHANAESVWIGSCQYLVTRLDASNMTPDKHVVLGLHGHGSIKMAISSFLFGKNNNEHVVILAGYDLFGSLKLELSVLCKATGQIHVINDTGLSTTVVTTYDPTRKLSIVQSHGDDGIETRVVITDGDLISIILLEMDENSIVSSKVEHTITLSYDVRFFKADSIAADGERGMVHVSSNNRRFIRTFSLKTGKLIREYGPDGLVPRWITLDIARNTLIAVYASESGYLKFIDQNNQTSSTKIFNLPRGNWISDVGIDTKQQVLHLLTTPILLNSSNDLWQIQAGDKCTHDFEFWNTTISMNPNFSWISLDLVSGQLLRNISLGQIFFPSISVAHENVYIRGIHSLTRQGTLFAFSYSLPETVQSE